MDRRVNCFVLVFALLSVGACPLRAQEYGPAPVVNDPHVDPYLEALYVVTDDIRVKALQDLAQMGDRARMASRHIAPFLQDPSPAVRAQAAQSLAQIGYAQGDAVAALREGLADEDSALVGWCAVGLIGMGFGQPEMAPVLQRHQGHDGPLTSACIRGALAALMDTEDAVALLRQTPNEEKHLWYTAWVLELLGEAAVPTLPYVGELLGCGHPFAVRYASETAENCGEAALAIAPQLVAALDQADGVSLPSVLQAIAALGPDVPDAEQRIVRHLADQNRDVRRGAADALASIGAESQEVQAQLTRMAASDPDPLARSAAVGAIADPATQADAVLLMCELLTDPDDETRRATAQALGFLGEVAGPATPQLAQVLTADQATRTRRFAGIALGMIGPPAATAVPALTQALINIDEDFWVRRNAAEAIGLIGTADGAAVQGLVDALSAGD